MCFSISISSYTTANADEQKKHYSTSLPTAPPKRKIISIKEEIQISDKYRFRPISSTRSNKNYKDSSKLFTITLRAFGQK